jgi:hypothetical protein
MLLIDRLLMGGIGFVLDKIGQAVLSELDDEDHLREELLALQMRFELGEVSKETFDPIERALLQRLRVLREEREGTTGMEFKVTGVEASFVPDLQDPDDER